MLQGRASEDCAIFTNETQVLYSFSDVAHGNVVDSPASHSACGQERLLLLKLKLMGKIDEVILEDTSRLMPLLRTPLEGADGGMP